MSPPTTMYDQEIGITLPCLPFKPSGPVETGSPTRIPSVTSRQSSDGDIASILSSMIDPVYSGVRSPEIPVQLSPAVDDTNEFVSSVMLGSDGTEHAQAIVRISLLGAGFVCGVGGRNITAIQRRTGASVKSQVSQSDESIRVFKVSAATTTKVKSAVAIMQEAVGIYKSLTEGDFRRQYVEPEVIIQGITFLYVPPPKDKMPNAACVKKLPPGLNTHKHARYPAQSFQPWISQQSQKSQGSQGSQGSNRCYQSTLDLDSFSSVDSNDSDNGGNIFAPHYDGSENHRGEYYDQNRHKRREQYDARDDGPRRHGRHTPVSSPDEGIRARRTGSSSPFTPSAHEHPVNIRNTRNSHGNWCSPGHLMRATHSTPDLTMTPDPDRADRDWRKTPPARQASMQPRNLLQDFRGMHV